VLQNDHHPAATLEKLRGVFCGALTLSECMKKRDTHSIAFHFNLPSRIIELASLSRRHLQPKKFLQQWKSSSLAQFFAGKEQRALQRPNHSQLNHKKNSNQFRPNCIWYSLHPNWTRP
jgi:hypothetical protein